MALWCNAKAPSISGQAKRRHWYQRSDWLRVLVNSSVLMAGCIAATSSSYMRKPKWPAQGKPSMLSGSRLRISVLRLGAPPMINGSLPTPRAWVAACSRLPIVALMAQV